jgi:hypothetical protein
MATNPPPGVTLTMAEDIMVRRMDYAAMRLARPRAFGPPTAAALEIPELELAELDAIA